MLADLSSGGGKPKNEFLENSIENMKKLNRALGGPAGDITKIQEAQKAHKEKQSKMSLATKVFWIIFTDANGI